MKTDSYQDILHRKALTAEVEEHFKDQVNLLEEIVDYGTNLIPRCFVSSKKTITDIILLPVLLKHSVTMLDSVHILVSNGAVNGAILPTRSLFESSLYMKWILFENTDLRAKQYYVGDLRNRQNFLKKLIKGNKENEVFFKKLEKFKQELIEKYQSYESLSITEFEEIENILKSNEYSDINNEFNKLRNSEYSLWYKPNGPNSIKDMAYRLGYSAEYEIIYHQFSKVSHANTYSKQVKFAKGRLVFQPIRSLSELSTILTITFSLAFNTYDDILKKYRPTEIENYKKKYRDEWRTRFLSFKNVEYKTEYHEI